MNRRKLTPAVIAGVMLIGFGAIAAEQEKAQKKQATCPVMGGKINKAQYADVKGKRIYVCCPGCIGKIKADPDTYIKKMEAEGIVLDKTPQKGKDEGHKNDHSSHQH